MLSPFESILFSVATWVAAYMIQAKAEPNKVRVGKSVFTRFRQPIPVEVVQIEMSQSGYVAMCKLPSGEVVDILADDALLKQSNPPFSTVLFASEYAPSGYELPPLALRTQGSTMEYCEDYNHQYNEAFALANLMYQVRLVLFTAAFICAFQAPHISATISLVAFVLTFLFIRPNLSYTKCKISGIIKVKNALVGKSMQRETKDKKKPESVAAKKTGGLSSADIQPVSQREAAIQEINARLTQCKSADSNTCSDSSEKADNVTSTGDLPASVEKTESGSGDETLPNTEIPQVSTEECLKVQSELEALNREMQNSDPFANVSELHQYEDVSETWTDTEDVSPVAEDSAKDESSEGSPAANGDSQDYQGPLAQKDWQPPKSQKLSHKKSSKTVLDALHKI